MALLILGDGVARAWCHSAVVCINYNVFFVHKTKFWFTSSACHIVFVVKIITSKQFSCKKLCKANFYSEEFVNYGIQ